MSENETIFPTLYLVFTKMNINVIIKITDNLLVRVSKVLIKKHILSTQKKYSLNLL